MSTRPLRGPVLNSGSLKVAGASTPLLRTTYRKCLRSAYALDLSRWMKSEDGILGKFRFSPAVDHLSISERSQMFRLLLELGHRSSFFTSLLVLHNAERWRAMNVASPVSFDGLSVTSRGRIDDGFQRRLGSAICQRGKRRCECALTALCQSGKFP